VLSPDQTMSTRFANVTKAIAAFERSIVSMNSAPNHGLYGRM